MVRTAHIAFSISKSSEYPAFGKEERSLLTIAGPCGRFASKSSRSLLRNPKQSIVQARQRIRRPFGHPTFWFCLGTLSFGSFGFRSFRTSVRLLKKYEAVDGVSSTVRMGDVHSETNLGQYAFDARLLHRCRSRLLCY